MPLLEVEDLLVSYGTKQIVNGVTLEVNAGEAVCIIGHNGSGKSTFMKGLFGLARVTGGRVLFDRTDITNRRPFQNLKRGIGYLAQGGQVFGDLSVDENLEMGGYSVSRRELRNRAARVYDLFPPLMDRKRMLADTLSGGERQMLAIGMALMLSPQLLLLDEPTGALAGPVVERIVGTVKSLVQDHGIGLVLVEQNVDVGLRMADRIHVFETGRVIFSGTSVDMKDEHARARALGLT